MATKDGKTFGMTELERLYDYMADHKDYGFKTFVNYCTECLDMSHDIAEEAVVAMRKERRKAILEQAQKEVDKAHEAFHKAYEGLREWSKGLRSPLPPASTEERICDPSLDLKKALAYASSDTIAPSVEKTKDLMADWASRHQPDHYVSPDKTFLDRLGTQEKIILDIITEGERFRDEGGVNPYRGNTLAHCLHSFGWVQRDLQLALEKATNGAYKARVMRFDGAHDAIAGSVAPVSSPVELVEIDVGMLVQKYKGYRFPGEVVAMFNTRKGKLRYVVEGIGDGNDGCLHIFSAIDLQELKAEHGWIYSADGYWWWSLDYPTKRHDRGSIRPATAAEHQFIRAIAEGTPKPFGTRKG